MTGMGKDVMAQSRLARTRTRTWIVISVLLGASAGGHARPATPVRRVIP